MQIISTEKWKKESEVTPLPQVAGHGSWDKSQAILTNKNGYILKPIQPPPRGDREVEFYQNVTTSEDPAVAQFADFIPKFYGSCTKKDGRFLMIENATTGMIQPCIMDIKIGAKTYGPDASEEKKAKQDASYAGTKKPFGFSVLGMSVYHGKEKEEFKVKDKNYGKNLNKDNIDDFIATYFDKESESLNTKLVIEIFTERLKTIEKMYSQQKVFHIFGSSILFVYDAAVLLGDDKTKDELQEAVILKMIDFAHVHPANGEADTNYITGIRNLINLIEKYRA